ncbi:MAG: nucleotidyltransferase domain-containing protein [Nitrospirae bacterium]|nr:nucleotidyltransferase domain-containing protein [Nitrospirota bacterium]
MASEILSKLKNIFLNAEDVEFAYLFGSCAYENAFPTSDIDIAVYMCRETAFFDKEMELHAVLSRALKSNAVDLVFLNRTKNIILLEEIVRSGKIVCDRNPQLRETFELNVLHNAMDFKYQRKVFAGI